MDDAEQLLPAYMRFVARRGGLERSAAQHLARDPAGEPRHRGNPRRMHPGGCCRCSRISPRTARTSTPRSEGIRAGAEGSVGEDHANRERIAKLLRFSSTHTDREEQNVSLADYVSRMKEGQDKIYSSPQDFSGGGRTARTWRSFRKRSIEVRCSPSASTNGWSRTCRSTRARH